MPTFPKDFKGMILSAIKIEPVVILEHRWLHNIKGDVPKTHLNNINKIKKLIMVMI